MVKPTDLLTDCPTVQQNPCNIISTNYLQEKWAKVWSLP